MLFDDLSNPSRNAIESGLPFEVFLLLDRARIRPPFFYTRLPRSTFELKPMLKERTDTEPSYPRLGLASYLRRTQINDFPRSTNVQAAEEDIPF